MLNRGPSASMHRILQITIVVHRTLRVNGRPTELLMQESWQNTVLVSLFFTHDIKVARLLEAIKVVIKIG